MDASHENAERNRKCGCCNAEERCVAGRFVACDGRNRAFRYILQANSLRVRGRPVMP